MKFYFEKYRESRRRMRPMSNGLNSHESSYGRLGVSPGALMSNGLNSHESSYGFICIAWFLVLITFASSAMAIQPPPPSAPQPITSEHLHNVWQLAPRIISGSEPEGEASFRELAALGIQTILSVDGITPQLELAKKYGLRYVHVPIGYDGIDAQAALLLTRVGREDLGKIYIHCHHGKHRGPAAAAIVCRAADGRSADAARLILEKAGTGKEYPGLWRDVDKYTLPKAGTALPELAEKSPVPSLAAAMAKIDRHFDHLKLIQATQWRTPADHPDLVPRNESVQLGELFVEASRSVDHQSLRDQLARSATMARELEVAIETGKNAEADKKLVELSSSCKVCHERHRNTK